MDEPIVIQKPWQSSFGTGLQSSYARRAQARRQAADRGAIDAAVPHLSACAARSSETPRAGRHHLRGAWPRTVHLRHVSVQVDRPITVFESVTDMAQHYGYRL